MKKISTRQLIIFYFIYSFSIKFLMLPQLLSKTAGADGWISAAFGTIIELLVLWFVLSLIQSPKFKVQKFILPLMLAIFLLQIFILINQSFNLLKDNLFENLSVYYFSVPMILLGVFFCFMPTRSVFRSGEIFFVFIIFGIILSVFPALAKINPQEVLPIWSSTGSIFSALYLNLIYFESAFFLLMFRNDIKVEKHFRKKFMTVATIVGAFFVFFIFMFYALFGPLAPMKNVAVTNLTIYSSYMTGNGRLDWVLVTMWLLLLLLRFGVTFFCAFMCLRNITGLKKRAGILGAGIAVFVWVVSTFVFSTSRNLNAFIHAIPWLIASLYIAIPVAFFAASLLQKRRRDV